MTVEGTFPKGDGDVLYASEANRFANAGQFIKIGSFATIGSQTAEQDIGSVIISAGSLSNPFSIFTNFYIDHSNTRDNLSMQISGIGANATTVIGSVATNSWHGNSNCFAGSPFGNGVLSMAGRAVAVATPYAAADTYANATTISNIDTGSDIVIIFKSKAASNLTLTYDIQSFRGAS